MHAVAPEPWRWPRLPNEYDGGTEQAEASREERNPAWHNAERHASQAGQTEAAKGAWDTAGGVRKLSWFTKIPAMSRAIAGSKTGFL